jgi:hypothetical protein
MKMKVAEKNDQKFNYIDWFNQNQDLIIIFMITVRVLAMILVSIFSIGLLISGSLFCWISQKNFTLCSDWQWNQTYQQQSCNYVLNSVLASKICNNSEICYCIGPNDKIKCLLTTPKGNGSTNFLVSGMILVCFGFIGPILFITCMIRYCENSKD